MMIAPDIYSLTNPAICSIILWAFLTGYEKETIKGCEFPLLFLPLPFILSRPIRGAISQGNSRTTLLTWVSRHPESLIGLKEKIEKANIITRESFMFGIVNRVFILDDNGLLYSNKSGIKVSKLNSSDMAEISEFISSSKIFGAWCGQIRNSKTVYSSLGMTL